MNVTATGSEEVRAPEVYKDITQLRDKVKSAHNDIEGKSLPPELQELISREIAFPWQGTSIMSNINSFDNTGEKVSEHVKQIALK